MAHFPDECTLDTTGITTGIHGGVMAWAEHVMFRICFGSRVLVRLQSIAGSKDEFVQLMKKSLMAEQLFADGVGPTQTIEEPGAT